MKALLCGLIIALSVISCKGIETKDDGRIAWLTMARDPKVSVPERAEAFQRLSGNQKQRLKHVLNSQLPGGWNQSTLETDWLLGTICDAGDVNVIAKLRAMFESPVETSGHLRAVLTHSIKKMEAKKPLR